MKFRVRLPNLNKSLGAAEWQWFKQDGTNNRVRRGVRPDSERNREESGESIGRFSQNRVNGTAYFGHGSQLRTA
jgi:hypothetical protein